jgi:hypothetical protein
MEQNPSLEANRSSRNSHFVEPEGSLRYLQDPATCPYPEPEQSSHVFPSHFIKTCFSIILGLPGGLFPSGLPTKILYAPLLCPTCATCLAHLILLDLITGIIIGGEYRA